MRTQVRDQTAAFVRGFKSMVSWDWLQMFSGPELQKLISGDSADLDLQDLRFVSRHVIWFKFSPTQSCDTQL